MKFSQLPVLEFTAKDRTVIRLAAPVLCCGETHSFLATWVRPGAGLAKLAYVEHSHPAHAFFASQISLEDCHAS